MKRSTLFAGLGIALLFTITLWAFVRLEDAELDAWDAPASMGEYVVSLRVDRGDLRAFDDACRQVARHLPESHSGDGQTTHYQNWRDSGWCRMNRHVVAATSLQMLANRTKAFSCEHCRIQVIDSHGQVYAPKH